LRETPSKPDGAIPRLRGNGENHPHRAGKAELASKAVNREEKVTDWSRSKETGSSLVSRTLVAGTKGDRT